MEIVYVIGAILGIFVWSINVIILLSSMWVSSYSKTMIREDYDSESNVENLKNFFKILMSKAQIYTQTRKSEKTFTTLDIRAAFVFGLGVVSFNLFGPLDPVTLSLVIGPMVTKLVAWNSNQTYENVMERLEGHYNLNYEEEDEGD